ncbi:ABC-type antimicrobial peptide transport system, ATPase component [Desulfosporosinus acidiphilus SJ4]|uniref:ABC-type antimicrobial peptide transport system, ATPase component n=1 Tax=Desulfosporosinus acidiphilus (strain DSM 22704 / JCM 16185 / SJ4) TaxID=646529 RepID=I4DB80_DESAJ|nr:ABC transporter ATP-binding protein [Desulfosporosinus acidiphilus]AFM43054.1 ABC-type antimicrobial peptide transport system, ATPase component [Desulfosporosinus acidiphilus SJ4]
MIESLVEMQKISKIYYRGDVEETALVSATCSVKPGDRIALVGPSGSGKSTLLHLMGGLDHPSSGNISWPGLGSWANLRPQKISFIFQMQSLLPPLTVVENVELPLLLGQIEAIKARKTALETLNRMRLNIIADKLPEELSGGQAQRVAVARALASRPQLILADEPTGQLDHPTAQHLFDVLLDSLEGSDTALVVATHDQAIAERMNTIWQMQHGVMEVVTC